jgi:hypothetical protein
VEYVGELGAREKLELLGGSFALLNPVQWAEPFGLVMIEALATGTPVVGTRLGAAPEIIDEGVTGHLRSGRPALAAALLAAPELDRRACRAAALRRFDTERMVAEHVRFYEQVLARRPRATTLPMEVAASHPREGRIGSARAGRIPRTSATPADAPGAPRGRRPAARDAPREPIEEGRRTWN